MPFFEEIDKKFGYDIKLVLKRVSSKGKGRGTGLFLVKSKVEL